MNPTEKHFQALDDLVQEQASRILAEGEQHAPMLFVCKAVDGDRIEVSAIVALVGRVPMPMVPVLQVQLCAQGEADFVAFVDEAWCATAIKGDTRRPSERTDRSEMLVVSIVTKEGQVVYSHPIERNPTKLGKGERVDMRAGRLMRADA